MVDLAGKKVNVQIGSKSCECIVESMVGSSPPFGARCINDGELMTYFSETIAERLNQGEALNMKLA